MTEYVTVKLSELMKAVALPKMKRGPRGAHGSIPKTTILNFEEGSLLVEAPTHTTALIIQGTLQAKVLVDAAHLKHMLEKLPKVEFIELGIDRQNCKFIMKVVALMVALECRLLP
jgi:hypothetical protein